MAIYAKVGSTGEIVRKMQTIHKLPINGVFDEKLAQEVREVQAKNGVTVNGYVDDATLRIYQNTWTYIFKGYTPIPISGAGVAVDGNLFQTAIAGILLYGVFKVLMKIF